MNALVVSALLSAAAPSASALEEDTALLFVAECISEGSGNFYLYHEISTQEIVIDPDAFLEYDVFLPPGNPEPKGGIDVLTTDGSSLRDSGAKDEEGRRAHGDADLSAAIGKWIHRRIALKPLAGKTTRRFVIQVEGDPPGRYLQFLDNVRVTREGRAILSVYENGKPASDRVSWKEGYSKETALIVLPRADVERGVDPSAVVERELERQRVRTLHADFDQELHVVEEALRRAGREDLLASVADVRREVDPARHAGASAEAYTEVLHRGRHKLDHAHPVMREYTGYLVGHAHIDFQWLWEWPETVEECKKTFGQATRFMDKYPEFTFTQSSPALYVATEEHHPDVFERIRHYVKEGRWEVAGGRWCEGDTNLISAESHARHLLYGQRYFREKFGKIATVGWEPDTFGHCWTMPQILRLAGIRYYYFCRAGKGKPLFHWEAPDGSKVLAFEEPASGSWYNSDVTEKFLEELLAWEDATGGKDLMWVYGVGNHGGGPTREHLLTALDWQKRGYLPGVKFATAQTFFETLEKKVDLTRVPTIRDELNFVFPGCFTTHGDIKRWNRDAESLTVAAESIASGAWLEGAAYPGSTFASMWKDIAWNHHHDTLPGTSIHPSYDKSREMYAHVLEHGRKILKDAIDHLAHSTAGPESGIVVWNSLPFARTDWVELETSDATASRLSRAQRLGPAASNGGRTRIGFVATVPPLGSRAVTMDAPDDLIVSGATVSAGPDFIENDLLRVEIDPQTGTLPSIRDKRHDRQVLSEGQKGHVFEVHWEKPHPMSAWQIGPIERVDRLVGEPEIRLLETGPHRAVVRIRRHFNVSTIQTDVSLVAGLDRIEFETTIDWKEKGGDDHDAPFLKVAFPLAVAADAKASYEIPYGDIERPRNGDEVPALKWVDLGDGSYGVSLMNDAKHGHSVAGNVLRLSLVRASYYPDPEPDQYMQRVRYALVPHKGSWKDADVARRSFAFNTPLLAFEAKLSRPPAGASCHDRSFLEVGPPAVIATGVKKAEDGDAIVVRFYESHGKAVRASLAFDRPVESAEDVDLLEDPIAGPRLKIEGSRVECPLRAHEIKTIRVRLGAAAR
jgi:alpha-mannosidase